MMTLVYAILTLAGGLCLIHAIALPRLPVVDRPGLQRHLQQKRSDIDTQLLLRVLEPWLAVVAAPLEKQNNIQTLLTWFDAAARKSAWPFGLRAAEWLALSIALPALVTPLLLIFFSGFGTVVTCLILSAFAPLLWLRGQAAAAQRSILRQAPDFLDTVALLLRAGSDFSSALARYLNSAAPGQLTDHLVVCQLRLESGMPLHAALLELDQQLQLPPLRALFAAMREALKTGASLAPVLQSQSELLRDQWFEAAEKRAAEAAVKLSLPLMLIFAAVLLIVMGPLAVQFMSGF